MALQSKVNVARTLLKGGDDKKVSLEAAGEITTVLNEIWTELSNTNKTYNKLNVSYQALLDDNTVLECNDPAKVDAFLAKYSLNSYEQAQQELSKKVRHAVHKNVPPQPKPNLREPTVSEELAYWRKIGESDDAPRERSHDMKALQSIPDFHGGNESQWRAFEHPWIVAIRNRSITEQDLRTTLYQKLKGSAATFYLSIPGIETMSFGNIMAKLREQYTSDTLTAFNKIASMTQKTGESVKDFSARMIVECKGSQPRAPHELAVLVAGTKTYVMPNPMREEEEATFPERLKESQTKLANSYLRGLRPDITSRMTSDKYTDFAQVVEAAEKAEWMKDSIQTGMIHTLEVEVNAMNLGGKKNNFKFERKDQGGQKNDACFRCGKTGHWAAECRLPGASVAMTEQANFQRSRAQLTNRRQFPLGTRGGFRGRGRGSNRKFGQFAPRPIPWNHRHPARRSWMVRRRAALNKRVGSRGGGRRFRLHHLFDETEEDSADYNEALTCLEQDLQGEDPAEYEVYLMEVAEMEETYDGIVEEEEYEEAPKN